MSFMLQKALCPLEGKFGSGYLVKRPHAPLRGNVGQNISSRKLQAATGPTPPLRGNVDQEIVSTEFLASKGPTPLEGKCGSGYLFMNFMLQKAPRLSEGKCGSGYRFDTISCVKRPHAP